MKHPSVTVILPTYNEADNIVPLIRQIRRYVPTAAFLVVDDNSPDGTATRVRRFQAAHPREPVELLVRTRDRGLTRSLKAGIDKATGDIIVWMDCDFSHPPQVIPRLLSAVSDGVDVAIASRQNFDVLSRILNATSMFFFGNDVTDYTTGFLAAKNTVLRDIPLRGDYGEYCIDLLVRAKRKKFRIRQVPYMSPPRRSGETKTSPDLYTLIRHGLGYITMLISLIRL